MANRLVQHINSGYIAAANAMRPQGKQHRVVAYVESYDDILFWRSVLENLEDENTRYEVMLPSRTTLSKGKKMAMMNDLGPHLGECMIACVDADYDYLMQRATDCSRQLLDNPYVFHTHVYAIENYQCYAEGLHTVCVMATLNDRQLLDLPTFMHQYSQIVWPLFVWNIWSYRHGRFKEFSMGDMTAIISFHDINPLNPSKTLDYVRRQVNRKVAWLQQHFPEARADYAALRDELQQLGVTPQDTYLYIQGHSLVEGVILPLLGPICAMLRRDREREIRSLACHQKQMQNELSSYQHSQIPLDVALRKNTEFKRSTIYQQLLQSLRQGIKHPFS